MLRKALMYGLMFGLSGCMGQSIPLDPQWAPLSEIRQADWVADGMVTTVAGVAYTRVLSDLATGEYLNALLTHERVHAQDQEREGVDFYINYLAFPWARWDYEKRAWAAEIAYKRAHGLEVNPQEYADLAVENYFGMVDRPTALAFFRKAAFE